MSVEYDNKRVHCRSLYNEDGEVFTHVYFLVIPVIAVPIYEFNNIMNLYRWMYDCVFKVGPGCKNRRMFVVCMHSRQTLRWYMTSNAPIATNTT